MTTLKRREFLKISAAVAAQGMLTSAAAAQSVPGKKMRLGVIAGVGEASTADAAIAHVRDLGIPTCQISVNNYAFTPELAASVRAALAKYDVEPTALIVLGPGGLDWNFYQGPMTNGLVPRGSRRARVKRLKAGSDFCAQAGIPAIHTHCGFIPENPNDELYQETVEAIREVAGYARNNGQVFLCEMGQETPVTLLRAIQDVGLDNVGVNLDTANLLLYGKGNPVDALDVIGKYVRGVHAKDGFYPTDPVELGREVPIGEGKVDFPRFIAGLKKINYTGPLTIEREISGPKQIEDIKKAAQYLSGLIG